MRTSSTTTLLLIASDVDATQPLRRLLETNGHPFAHARSGKAAIEWLRGEPTRPALILIDWTLPAGEGARFLSRQASDPALSPIPVVVLAEIAQMRSIPTVGVSATLAKPVRPRTLLEVISVLCGHPRPREIERVVPPPAESTTRLGPTPQRAKPAARRAKPAAPRVNTEDVTIPAGFFDELSSRHALEDRTMRTFDSGPTKF